MTLKLRIYVVLLPAERCARSFFELGYGYGRRRLVKGVFIPPDKVRKFLHRHQLYFAGAHLFGLRILLSGIYEHITFFWSRHYAAFAVNLLGKGQHFAVVFALERALETEFTPRHTPLYAGILF